MATPSQEETPRRLIEIMAKHFSSGVRTEDLRRQFSATTGLANQCFYNNFKYLKEWAWIFGDGGRDQLWFLNPAAPWKAPVSTVDDDGGTDAERLEKARRGRQLGCRFSWIRKWSGSWNWRIKLRTSVTWPAVLMG
jgi:hypothetical protein